MTTKAEDIWECSKCGDIKGKHDQYFDGVCKKCNEPKDYSNQNCSTCSLGQGEQGCELKLQAECISNTGDETHKDYWIDKNEGEDE